MGLIFLIAGITFIVTSLWIYADSDDGIAALVIAIMFAVFAGIIGMAIAQTISAMSDPYEVTNNTPLVLVADGTSVEGRIALFSGFIDTSEVFRYYVKDANGGMTLHSQKADRSVIYEDSGKPYMKTICLEKKDAWYILNDPDGLYDCRYEFHVPEGSVSREIVLDGN